MGDAGEPKGKVAWHDLTVENADEVRDFYAAVVGWEVKPISMGDYDDYAMKVPGGGGAVGVCHARGPNVGIPPVWLMYVTVADMDVALAAVRERGGEVVTGPKSVGSATMAVIRDPAGAVMALYQE